MISALGMFIAVVVTLFDQGIVDYKYIILGIAIGAIIGAVVARSVAMTSMPEMVAMLTVLVVWPVFSLAGRR